MKFALVDNIKTEATKGAKGICPNCGSELIAKSGELKINHWAHKVKRKCDSWWEPETEWHRSWKNNYPTEWQEVSLIDEQSNERHIADVCTDDNLVIEFQHSYINPQERTAREKFYQNMVWVVDGTRLKRDYPRFLKGRYNFIPTDKKGIFTVESPEEYFPSTWLGSSVPVVFDFLGTQAPESLKEIGNNLYCLFPIRIGRRMMLTEFKRKTFINTTKNGEWLSRTQIYMNKLSQDQKEHENQILIQRRLIQLEDQMNKRLRQTRKRRRRF